MSSYTFGSSTDNPDIDSLEGLIQSIMDWSFLSHGDLGELDADDHSHYLNNTRGDTRYLYKENTAAFTPDGDYEPATKKYVDDIISGGGGGHWTLTGDDIFYSAGNVGIGSAPGSYGLDVDDTGRFVQKLYLDEKIGTDNYQSRETGWQGDYNGYFDFRRIFTDELIAKTFIADIDLALVSGQMVSKSVTQISRDFTVPATSSTGTLYVECIPGHPDAWTFEVGDWLRLQIIDRTGGGLTWVEVWATVASQDDINGVGNANGGEQSYTITIEDDGTSPGSIVHAGAAAQDLGQSGNGYIQQEAGSYSLNTPYLQIATWETDPSDPNNTTVRTRLGNLKGLEGYDIVPTDPGYGLYCDNAYLTGKIIISSGSTKDDIDSAKSDATNALDLIFFDNTGKVIDAAAPGGDPGLYLGSQYLGYYESGTWKTYMDNQGQFYLGGKGGALQWDGTTLKIEGEITLTNIIPNDRVADTDPYSTGQDEQELSTLNYDSPSTTTVDSGTTDSTTADKLVDSSQDFNTTVVATDVVLNTTDSTDAVVTAVDSDTQLSLSSDIMVNSENYEIKRGGLYMDATHLGYYSGQGWMTYMENNGNFYLGGTSGALRWDGINSLYIEGEIVITSGSTKDAITAAQDTADGKATTFRQSSVPTANAAGDLWYDTGNGNKLYVATSAGDDQRGGGEWMETKDADINANSALIPNDADGLIDFTGSTPTADGLYLRDDHLGFYDKTGIDDWTAYMDNQGQFYLGSVGDSSYLAWNGSVLTIRGAVNATSGTIGGVTLGNSTIYTGVGNFDDPETEFYLDDTGQFSLGDKLSWNGSILDIDGSMTVESGSIGGWDIDTDSIYIGTEHTTDGYSTNGTTFHNDGSIHAKNFYVNADGTSSVRAHSYVYGYLMTDAELHKMTHTESTASTSWDKQMGLNLNESSNLQTDQTIRIAFEIKSDISGERVEGKIYRNGNPVGQDEQSVSDTWESKSEDISGWNDGDEIQLWAKVSLKDPPSGATCWVRNIEIKGEHAAFVNEIIPSDGYKKP